MRATSVRRDPFIARVSHRVGDFATLTPARFAIAVFASLVIVFTILFSLPIATADGRTPDLIDALFTAISVICVTGLSTVDMATFWSPFGHVLVFIGVEIGGIGVLTVASILGLIISRRMGLRQKLMAAGDANPLRIRRGPVAEGQAVRLGETRNLLATVAVSVIVIELAIAALIFPRLLIAGVDPLTALWESIYFSAMAFTNTGFSPAPEGISMFASDWWFLGALMLATVLGAIGFPVIYALRKSLFAPHRWSLHVKLTLVTFGLLIVGGTVAYLALEWDNPDTMGSMDLGERVLHSLFISVMSRSGGFSAIDIASLDGSSLLVTDMLMFVGGGSASTAGGIKVTTLAILFLAAFAEARGADDMEAAGRRIPIDVLRLAVSVVLWGATIVATASIIILLINDDAPLDYVLFDVISAFATCGLTTGFTQSAGEATQAVIAATMFLGRIGTVTLAAALAASTRRQLFRRPEERPIVG
ncbi:potassium transporter TrkG [Salinibacterium sp. ZJ70]|uniref:TrkH family potassium uptake protein n=1 Tax=Salinibacterium sp. ZJ70 TaxID=2708084 RepID=UPI00142102C3